MITVELHRRPAGEGHRPHHRVAALSVRPDGTYELDDPEAMFPLSLRVLAPDGEDRFARVTFQDDPTTWVRNLGSLLGSGYLFAVITRDDEALVEGVPAPSPGA